MRGVESWGLDSCQHRVWEGKDLGGRRGRGREETPVSGNRRVSWEKGQEQGFRGGLELKLQGLGFRG